MEMLLAVTEATELARIIGAPSIYSARLGEARPAEPGVRTEASALFGAKHARQRRLQRVANRRPRAGRVKAKSSQPFRSGIGCGAVGLEPVVPACDGEVAPSAAFRRGNP